MSSSALLYPSLHIFFAKGNPPLTTKDLFNLYSLTKSNILNIYHSDKTHIPYPFQSIPHKALVPVAGEQASIPSVSYHVKCAALHGF